MASLIVILDDEQDIVEVLRINLAKAGFNVEGFLSVAPFYEFIQTKKPDLIILDLMLPEKDGFEICKDLKNDVNFKEIPIIMLTARGEEIDKVLGLEFGADDYITKPFSVRELVARVKTVIKRYQRTRLEPEQVIYITDNFIIDRQKVEVYINKKQIKLTFAEFKILELLSCARGQVFSRDKILQHLWGDEKIVVDRTIDVHIRNLRVKLGKYGKLIENKRGVGYRLKV
ncbi:response regulator transcription factor [bacterium]